MARHAKKLSPELTTRQEQLSRAFPLGVSEASPPVQDAVNVAVFAPGFSTLDVHFQDAEGRRQRVELPAFTDGIHHGTVQGLEPGSRYAFWPHGEELPESGQLLLDPYGRAIDNDGGVLRSVYVTSDFDWQNDARPHVPWRDTVIYECHVKGQTMLHPEIPEELRGTYAGLAHPVMIEYLLELGISTVELLPVHYHLDEPHLQDLGLANYWGYNTLGFFALWPGYATAAAQAAGPRAVQDEFRTMVKKLHRAGIEVILDVVYNHTAEGGKDQDTYSFRGLADHVYYRHDGHGNYLDTTGCGNTMNFNEPRVIQLALDSLRYWVEEFHIDGFRFDLAVSLARDGYNHFNPRHPFLVAVGADSVLSGTKLIAEPWDVGDGGWQTGHFPPGWTDWNDRFRDTVRDFWLADQAALAAGGPAGTVARLASSLAGSAELFAASGRTALASLNFVTAHDGFTLSDLVSYNRKHNEDNGEENRDGHDHNRSYNHGIEGHTGDSRVLDARDRTARNLMATLMLSLGVPMICAGDEIGRSQQGNNNAYCQDNALAWTDWQLDERELRMFDATRRLIRIRRSFMAHQPYNYPARQDSSYLLWFNAEGEPMTPDDWNNPDCRMVQLLMGSPQGVIDGLVVINGGCQPQKIVMPAAQSLQSFGKDRGAKHLFELLYTTSHIDDHRRGARIRSGEKDIVGANAISIYRA